MLKKAGFLSIILIISLSSAFGQVPFSTANPGRNSEQGIQRSVLRGILNKFSLSLMSGYGSTSYKHDLSGFTLLQKRQELFIIESSSANLNGPNTGYSDWIVNPKEENGLTKGPNDVLIDSDTAELKFKTSGTNIPIILSIHYNAGRFRIGGGVAAEFQTIGTISPRNNNELIMDQETDYQKGLATRYFGTAGVRVWDFWDYSFVVDAQAGKLNPGNNFNKGLMEQGTYFNIGAPVEKNFSEYFRAVLRPAVEFKNYTMHLPGSNLATEHSATTFYIQAGISLNYPEVPRCPINSCRTQLKHIHFGKEYRGQPITKKQNPGYGENHPELLMHKGRKQKGQTPKSDISRMKKQKKNGGFFGKLKGIFN